MTVAEADQMLGPIVTGVVEKAFRAGHAAAEETLGAHGSEWLLDAIERALTDYLADNALAALIADKPEAQGLRDALERAQHALDAIAETDVIEWAEEIKPSKRGETDDDEWRKERKSALISMVEDARQVARTALNQGDR